MVATHKKTIIIENVLTPYEIARYNEISRVLKGNLEVWFQVPTDVDRHWKEFPEIDFSYRFLNERTVHVGVKEKTPFRFGIEAWKLLSRERRNIERVVVCGWDALAYYEALLFCRLHGVHITLWSGSTCYEHSWRRVLFLPLVLLFIRFSNDFIAYGTRAKEYLVFLGAPEQSIEIFLNSVDVDLFAKRAEELRRKKRTLRRVYGVPENSTVFLFVGQLIERKGVRSLLQAFQELKDKRSDVFLVFVGRGYLASEIQKYKEKGVILIDHLEQAQLSQAYALADAFVLPSEEEVWGLVVNEALASNLPVLVSQNAGVSADLVQEATGLIIEEISPQNIAHVLETFLRMKSHFDPKVVMPMMRNKVYAQRIFGKKHG